jgi:GTP-binding protein
MNVVKCREMPEAFLYTLQDPKQLTGLFQGLWFRGRSEARIAMVGRSNVGKSTLINRLAGSRIARVSNTPGKTKAIQFFLWQDAGTIIADLPGYGFAKRSSHEKSSWASLIRAYFKADPNLRGAILLLDSKVGPTASDLEAIEFLHDMKTPWLPVFTKFDQLKTQSERMKRKSEVTKIFEAIGINIEQAIWYHQKDLKAIEQLKAAVQEESWPI